MTEHQRDFNYVVGFVFNKEKTHVILIQKQRPDWQKNKLNGVGGKIEYPETAREAMVREFAEETGLLIPGASWHYKMTLYCEFPQPAHSVEFFTSTWPNHEFPWHIANTTTEPLSFEKKVEVIRIIPIKALQYKKTKCVPNLRWIVNFMATDDIAFADVREKKRE